MPGRDLDYAEHVGEARAAGRDDRMRAGRRDRPALHHLHLGHDRPAQGHRARQWRPHGRAQMDDVERVRRQARRDVLGGLRRRLGGRPFLHRLRAAAARRDQRSCSRASRSARPTPAPTGASSPSMAWWRCSPRRPLSAPSRRRTRDGEHRRPLRHLALPHAVPGRRARRPRYRSNGPSSSWGCRSSTIGGRPRPARRCRRTRPGSASCRSNTARPACRCRATTSASSTTTGSRSQPGTLGNVVVKLPLPPGCLPTLWNADQRFRDAYLDEFPGYYKTADAGFIDDDGYLFVMSRTDDIINVAGHRLSTGAMEEVVAEPSRRRRMRGDRHRRRDEGPGAVRLHRAECRRRARRRRDRARSASAWCATHRPGRRLQDGGHRQAPAEDALGQDPARHHAEDRRPGETRTCRQRSTIRRSSTR